MSSAFDIIGYFGFVLPKYRVIQSVIVHAAFFTRGRHEFVPVEVQRYAYLNRPIPIGFDKTISQPVMVAVMTDLLELKPDDVVLEIGTGLGYQSAVLAELSGKVYSVEIIDELAQRAIERLKRQGYTNVEVRIGN